MIDRSPIPPARPGRPLDFGTIDRLRDASARLSRSSPGTGTLGIDSTAGSPRRKPGPSPFHARLTGSANPYAFAEVYGVPTTDLWAAYPNGRTSSAGYELNGINGLGGNVVEVHPVGSGAWYWFVWKSLSSSGGAGSGGIGTVPLCFCENVPKTLTMTSLNPACNYGMFQSCTLQYGPIPSEFAPLDLGSQAFISVESFPDVIAGGALFRYYLSCQYNVFSLTRLYPTSPYGSPYIDGVLYTWYVGSYGNTCSPFHLGNGTAYLGTGGICSVTISE
jgi:hypothetical protein